jgi:hypothetical protein
MRLRPLSLAVVVLATFSILASLGSLACTGTAPYGDASVDPGGAPGDGSADVPLAPADVAGRPNGADGGIDRAVDSEFPGPTPAVPLPVNGPRPHRLLPGPMDQLSGDSITSCSHQDPPTAPGDRWCVFYRRPGADGVGTELWVINLSKVAAGVTAACDGTSPHCLLLTKTLWTNFTFNGPTHPFSHQFDGDTLIYYADAVPPSKELYRGPVYAWRPGWRAPRQLTSGQGIWCFGHRAKAIAHCLDNIVGDVKTPESFELRAGPLDEAGTEPLPSLGRIRPLRANNTSGWQASFTPDGNHFVYSDLSPDPAVETLRMIATADLGRGTPRVLRNGISQWTIGNDNQRLYHLRTTAEFQGRQEHDVFATDLTETAAEVKLGSRALGYFVLGEGAADEGVSFLSRLAGDQHALRIARDSRAPDSSQTIFTYTGLLEGIEISRDHRYTVWLDGRFTGRVVRHTDLNVCQLNTRTDAAVFVPMFLANGGLVFFSQDGSEELSDRDGLYARPDDCGGVQRFATKIDHYYPIGDRGMVYGDERTPAGTVTLKYAAAVSDGGRWRLDTPVAVHNEVEAGIYNVLGGEPKYVVFRAANANAETWVFGPLPL